ncbi:hypothetical protein [Undibacterium sp.]|uniref:hypothetical protein n=1 Tax=Undibacterium sp. TaxID=1914977 RepID=UPI002731199B|nr:hypothetical protein [Undibacterium sp.]MDP1980209.1 hypothetical protein [Undibacterium sp.]
MPTFYSHDFPQYTISDALKLVEAKGIELMGNTLGELLIDLESKTGICVIPHDAPKYFRYFETRQSFDFVLVDIHIVRGDEVICPKQDLNFLLLPTDKVDAGMLAC